MSVCVCYVLLMPLNISHCIYNPVIRNLKVKIQLLKLFSLIIGMNIGGYRNCTELAHFKEEKL